MSKEASNPSVPLTELRTAAAARVIVAKDLKVPGPAAVLEALKTPDVRFLRVNPAALNEVEKYSTVPVEGHSSALLWEIQAWYGDYVPTPKVVPQEIATPILDLGTAESGERFVVAARKGGKRLSRATRREQDEALTLQVRALLKDGLHVNEIRKKLGVAYHKVYLIDRKARGKGARRASNE